MKEPEASRFNKEENLLKTSCDKWDGISLMWAMIDSFRFGKPRDPVERKDFLYCRKPEETVISLRALAKHLNDYADTLQEEFKDATK